MCHEDEYIRPNLGEPGDILVLTKPLGTQVAVNLKEWLAEKNDKWSQSEQYISEEQAKDAYFLAMESMAHLNKDSAKLMKKYGSNGATDITGFGLLGHAQNLVNVQQKEPLDFIIHSLPIIEKMEVINEKVLSFK